MSINVCIFGVSGYTGCKLIDFLDKHKMVNVSGVFGSNSVGNKLGDLHKNLNKLSKLKVTNYKDFNFSKTDLIFSCLPHGMFQKEIIDNLDPMIPIIDLSGDFRLDSFIDYENFYKINHYSKSHKTKFSYGLSEIFREQIKNSKFISNPGCYPTSILIPLIPLLKDKKLNIRDIIADSKSGVSGAGKQLKVKNLFAELSENFYSYGITEHKHYPEIMQEINKINRDVSLTFIPHLLPIISGIQSTIYINKNFDEKEYEKCLSEFFQDEPFIKIYKNNEIPTLKDIIGTNNLAIKVFTDYSKNKIIILSCLDNLIKGASGQAIQNMNIMFGFDEVESLI